MMTTRAARPFFAVVAVAALVLASCSSDGSDGASDPVSDPSTTTKVADVTIAGTPLERYADYQTVSYDDPAHWVCRPDAEDVCDDDLDTTVIEADGSTSLETFTPDPEAPIDCFYVYPTISRDEGTYSDWDFSPDEEGTVTFQQAARLGSQCRVFAPVYRQVTLTALLARFSGGDAPEGEGDPYADVLDAFRTYMANDNDGRGVVLIGHSQGAGMLTKLIDEEVDPNDDVRELLVGAYLAGGAVAVPEGEVVGGVFDEVPLCTEDGEIGCATTWATYRSTEPPGPDALFGKLREGDGVAGCVNPAGISGGDVPLHGYYPTSAVTILTAVGGGTPDGPTWIDGAAGDAIDTPFVSLPGLASGECTTTETGANVLLLTVHPDPGPRADDVIGDLIGGWGLHLVDINAVMGDVVDRVAEQSATYAG